MAVLRPSPLCCTWRADQCRHGHFGHSGLMTRTPPWTPPPADIRTFTSLHQAFTSGVISVSSASAGMLGTQKLMFRPLPLRIRSYRRILSSSFFLSSFLNLDFCGFVFVFLIAFCRPDITAIADWALENDNIPNQIIDGLNAVSMALRA